MSYELRGLHFHFSIPVTGNYSEKRAKFGQLLGPQQFLKKFSLFEKKIP